MYRGAAFLAATIDSVLHQSHPHFAVWILDENSLDDTQAVVSRYTDSLIKYVRNSHNLGPEGNWNRRLELAQGNYFKRLPHDDFLHPSCLERQAAGLDAGPDHASRWSSAPAMCWARTSRTYSEMGGYRRPRSRAGSTSPITTMTRLRQSREFHV